MNLNSHTQNNTIIGSRTKTSYSSKENNCKNYIMFCFEYDSINFSRLIYTFINVNKQLNSADC